MGFPEAKEAGSEVAPTPAPLQPHHCSLSPFVVNSSDSQRGESDWSTWSFQARPLPAWPL